MKVDGLRELDEMAAKLESTIHELPEIKRNDLLPGPQMMTYSCGSSHKLA